MDPPAYKLDTSSEVFRIQATEIPQYIAVKTRFITKKASALIDSPCKLYSLERGLDTAAKTITNVKLPIPVKNIGPIRSFVAPTKSFIAQTKCFVAPTKQFVLPAKNLTPIKCFKDASTTTGASKILRHSAIQTDSKSFSTIGIQCNFPYNDPEDNYFMDDIDAAEVEKEQITEADNASQKALFEEYFKSNTSQYVNGMVECLLCGEIGKSNPMEYHMAAHYEPKELCSHCGIIPMFKNHRCVSKPRLSRGQLRCPHFDCRVNAISLLELYDHINEHLSLKTYKCQKHCTNTYITASEFKNHLKSNKVALRTSSKCKYNLHNRSDRGYRVRVFPIYSISKKRVLVESFLSMKEAKNRHSRSTCQLCMKRLKNDFQSKNHAKRCRRVYLNRLKRITQKHLESIPISSLTAGGTIPLRTLPKCELSTLSPRIKCAIKNILKDHK